MSAALLFAALAFLSGCSPKARLYSAHEAVQALAAQAAQVRTERGRAWISMRSPEQKISFPAVIAVDRTEPERPLLRVEAMDPLGATHALMVLDQHARLTWIDYDQRRIYEMRNTWHGIPLGRLPELLLGFALPPQDGRVGTAGPDGFEVRTELGVFRYLMEWIDPGPRLALGSIDGEMKTATKINSKIKSALPFVQSFHVDYSHYLDKDDFYLPRDVKLTGRANGSQQDTVEINVAWRERRWNEIIPMQVFAVPNGLDAFERQGQ